MVAVKYYFERILKDINYNDAIDRVVLALKKEGFGVLTDIDMKQTMLEKLGVKLNNYRILGACNPGFAYQALQQEVNIGLLLPCNLVVRELENRSVAVTAIDPVLSMGMIENENLETMAREVQEKLEQVIAHL